MTPNEICEIMYCAMCQNPMKNRAICYGYDFTEMLREIIAEQDCDIWMDKMAEYKDKVIDLVLPLLVAYTLLIILAAYLH